MKGQGRRELFARTAFWIATRASRNQNALDRLCRWVLDRLLKTEFQVDDMVVAHPGFDPEELEQYEQGKSRLP